MSALALCLCLCLCLVLASQAQQWVACPTATTTAKRHLVATQPILHSEPKVALKPEDIIKEQMEKFFNPTKSLFQDAPAPFGHIRAAQAYTTEITCLTMTDVPLAPPASSPTIELTVKRIKRSDNPPRQLWMLAGGPGEVTTTAFGNSLLGVMATNYEADVYVVDWRGSGLSKPLFWCKDEATQNGDFAQSGMRTSRWQACYSEMTSSATIGASGITEYTTSNAARDLKLAIDRVNASNDPSLQQQEIWIAGYSYGTYLLNRFLTLYPDVAHGAIFDGVIYGENGTNLFSSFEFNQNLIMDKLFQICRSSSSSSSSSCDKITVDDFPRKVMDQLRNNSCPYLTQTPERIATMLKYSLLPDAKAREMLPMVFYRMNRCSESLDKVFLGRLDALAMATTPKEPTSKGTAPNSASSFSVFINNFVTMNELFDHSKTKAELLGELQQMSLGASENLITTFTALRDANAVPRYTEPLRTERFTVNTTNPAHTLKRVLFASGELDPQTPKYYADALFPLVPELSSSNDKVHLVIPGNTHIQTLGTTCGSAVAGFFVRGNDSAVQNWLASSSCSNGVSIDFVSARMAATTKIGEYLLDGLPASDIWDTAPSTVSAGLIVGVVIAAVAVVIIIIGATILLRRRSVTRTA